MSKNKELDNKVFVVPENDLEAQTIVELLKNNGYKEGTNLFITKQKWGASWKGLEPDIKEKLDNIVNKIDDSSVLEWKEVWEKHIPLMGYGGSSGESKETITVVDTFENYKKELLEKKRTLKANSKDIRLEDLKIYTTADRLNIGEPKKIKAKIYGVELQGENIYEAVDIDHHNYSEDDRSNPYSSLEQVAKIIKKNLDEEQRLIAANDRGYYPEMEKEADKIMGKTNNSIAIKARRDIFDAIRLKDRKAQNVTSLEERQAEEAIKNLKEEGILGLKVVHCEHSKSSPICDRLYGSYENLLIISRDGEYNFFGNSKVCEELQREFNGWTGDTKNQNSSFWGVGKPNEDYPNDNYPVNENFVTDKINDILASLYPEKAVQNNEQKNLK